jgi:curved DNA-binding protein CbpA
MIEPWAIQRLVAWLRAMGPKVETMGPYELLELSPTDDLDKIQDAYHAIAGTRHPDLFRGKLDDVQTESLMRVFGRVSNAYALLRDPEERRKFGGRRVTAERAAATPPGGTPAKAIPAGSTPPTGSPATGTPTGLRRINPKALSYARRAEGALATGDIASAILHLRMAIASDPGAKELRDLLADTEAKLKK